MTANGGIGGGMGGGLGGGGAGRNGGYGSPAGYGGGREDFGGYKGGLAAAVVPVVRPKIVPLGAPPPVAPLPTSAWLKAYGNINNPIATGWAYSPGDMTGARPMQDYPRYQTQPQRLAPGQPKYQDRVPSGVGPGDWRGQASNPRGVSGQNWGNPGSGSMGLGSSGGGRGGGGGRGF
jgi:hypothetical protein